MPKVEKSIKDILKAEFNLTIASGAFRFCDVEFATIKTTNPNNLQDVLIGVYAHSDKYADQIAPLFQETRYEMVMIKADGSEVPVSAIRYDGQKTDIIKNDPWASTLAVFSVPFEDYSSAQSITVKIRTSEAARQCDLVVAKSMPKAGSQTVNKQRINTRPNCS